VLFVVGPLAREAPAQTTIALEAAAHGNVERPEGNGIDGQTRDGARAAG
jgi:hypothetical protein